MSARASPGELRGVHVLIAMLAFFGVVIAINIGFSVVAVRSFPGEDEKHSYLQGLHYNDRIAARAREVALGWRANAALTRDAQGAVVEVRMVDRAGAPLTGVTLTGFLRRPATTRNDAPLTFTADGDGIYRAPVGALAPGAWTLEAVAARDTGSLTMERRLSWMPQ